MEKILRDGLDQLGVLHQADPQAPIKLDQYAQLLLEQNQVMNLTAITDPADVAALHMLDSAALLTCPDLAWSGKLLDVGSGAGFPGLALKILLPRLDVTLLDSLGKRVDWLNEIAGRLAPEGCRAVQGRAETLGQHPDWREQFDLVTARAVADLRILAELCLPFVKIGGKFLAMKGPNPETQEAQTAIETLGGHLETVTRCPIPGTNAVHSVVVVKKITPTPPRYPRRWTKIKKSPI